MASSSPNRNRTPLYSRSHPYFNVLELATAVGRNKSALAGVSGELTGRMPETVVARPYSGLHPILNSTSLHPYLALAAAALLALAGIAGAADGDKPVTDTTAPAKAGTTTPPKADATAPTKPVKPNNASQPASAKPNTVESCNVCVCPEVSKDRHEPPNATALSAKPAVKPSPEAAKVDEAVQNLMKIIKQPATKQAPTENKDFVDVGVEEGADMLEGGLEIGGMLTDDTVTRFGHDLFDAFNRAWRPPEGASYSINFSERNDPTRGSLITVRLNDTIIYEGFLTPRDEAITELGTGLARDIRNLIRNNANLENEEFY